jgi:hypothetical protein
MESHECEICKGKFSSKESLRQHSEAKHSQIGNQANKHRSNAAKRYFMVAVLILIIASISYVAYSNYKKPGEFDEFAKCLTKKGAVIYGNDYCQYTNKQLNWFGKSKRYLDYIKCIDNTALCDKKGVKVTPTWEINNTIYPQIQTFKTLSELTGCI